MKKLLLSVLFILSISPLLAMVGTNVPIKADEIVIGGNSYVEDVISQSEYNRLNYSGLLAEFLKQGGTIDTTNINPDYGVDDVVEEIGETIYEVLRDTGNFIDWLGDSIFQSEGTAYPENIKPRMNDTLSDNMWIFLGLAPFLNSLDSGTDIIVPTPPADYAQYVDIINGSGFDFIRNMDITTWNGKFHNVNQSYPSFNGIPASYTWYSYANSGTEIPWDKSKFSYITTALFCSEHGIDTVNITFDEVENKYKCILQKNNTQSYYNSSFPVMYSDGWINDSITPQGTLYGNFYSYSNYLSYANCNPWYNGGWSTKTLSDSTLEGLFQQLCRYVRNINIYVDGELWSQVGVPQDYTITLNPTTITPVDEHGRVRWKYDEEIYIDVDLMWQILDDFLNDPDQRLLRFSDIEDCIVDEDGQTAIAVKVINDEDNVDEYYIKNYGSLIPVFPTDVSFPVSIDKMVSIVTVPVSVIPDDLMGVLKTLFIGTLMVCLLQRLLE